MRSYARILEPMGIELVELSLLQMDSMLGRLQSMDLQEIRFVLSAVGMGLDISTRIDGKDVNLWDAVGAPRITLHGDSPAYFFDRHVVPDSNFISLYAFPEHLELRKRLPKINGPVGSLPPILLDRVTCGEMDMAAKKHGTLLFLKNGRDPAQLKRFWSSFLDGRISRYMFDLATQLESDLDSSTGEQIDDLVTRYFLDQEVDLAALPRLRLLLIAQLDDYLRAVKCTRMAEALMDFPVEIRGNNWGHLDFSGRRATYLDECNYVDSIGLIRGSLGVIDMPANTASLPHDRVLRAYGSNTLCLTNAGQEFLEDLPHREQMSFSFERDSLQTKVAYLLAHPSDAVDMGVAVAEAFAKRHPPERSFEKMLDYAALAQLDRMPARPAGSQDFFVWPPRALR